jgi:hypothetical protein
MSREGKVTSPDWMTMARQLMDHLDRGGSLIPQSPLMRLGPGEFQYAHLQPHCSRYLANRATAYNQSTVLGLGSLGTLTLTALASAAWNSHRRRKTAMEAAAQWRSLGWLDVVVTSTRLLVLEDLAWRSVWFDRIVQLVPRRDGRRLDVLFEEFPALRLDGPPVPLLAILLHHLVNEGQQAGSETRTRGPLASGLGSVRRT